MELLQSATPTHLLHLAARFEAELAKTKFLREISWIQGEMTKRLGLIIRHVLDNVWERVEVSNKMQTGITLYGEYNPISNSITLKVVVEQ